MHDVAFMFVSGFVTPEHSTICRFIAMHKESIKSLFAQVLYVADNMKLIDYKMIVIDGTKIKANASKQFNGTIEDFKKKQAKLQGQIEKALEKQANAEDEEDRNYWLAKQERYTETCSKISLFLTSAMEQKNDNNSERAQNITDPDCRMLKSNGTFICGYNAQAAIDISSGLLLGADIVDQTNDKQAFPAVVEAIKAAVPATRMQCIDQSTFLADNGYYSPDTFEYAGKHDLDVYISDRTTETLYNNESNEKTKIGSKDCSIRRGKDGKIALECPRTQVWQTYSVSDYHGRTIYTFRTGERPTPCNGCRFYNRCVGATKNLKKDFEIDERSITNSDLIKAHSVKLHSEKGKRIYSKRMPSIEHVFGDIKTNMGMRTFLRRGLERVSTEGSLIATCFNLRRVFILAH